MGASEMVNGDQVRKPQEYNGAGGRDSKCEGFKSMPSTLENEKICTLVCKHDTLIR
jgi:hypothetical protein